MIDLHTHSTYSDGADSLETNLAAAMRQGVTMLGASDHVRRDSTWLPCYVDHVRRLAVRSPIVVKCGVEAKMLDLTGALDLPNDLDGVQYVAIADHQIPTKSGPVHPARVQQDVADRRIGGNEVIEMLVVATIEAARTAPRHPYIAHMFSALPKAGLDENAVPTTLLEHLGDELARSGAWVEANTKWACPGPRALGILARRGVRLVSGSDAHAAEQIGVFHAAAPTKPHARRFAAARR